jgi:hypothetical protein
VQTNPEIKLPPNPKTPAKNCSFKTDETKLPTAGANKMEKSNTILSG